jgi:regulator of replication initiation timing
MKYLLSIVFLIGLTVFAQERAKIKDNVAYRKLQNNVAEESIVKLKNGVLLVRLNMRKKEIAYYERFGNIKGAYQTRKKQEKQNSQITKGFSEQFDFCKVYYFAMEDSRMLLDGKQDSIKFYDSNMTMVDSLQLNSENYFIGEFGAVESDTVFYYKGTTPDPGSINNPEGVSYYGDQKNSLPALVIRNNDFYQLKEPFPYYSGYNPGGNVNKRYASSIRKLNQKLKGYYQKVKQQEGVNTESH